MHLWSGTALLAKQASIGPSALARHRHHRDAANPPRNAVLLLLQVCIWVVLGAFLRWRNLTREQLLQVQFDRIRVRRQRDAGEGCVGAANEEGLAADAMVGFTLVELLTQLVVGVKRERELRMSCILNPKPCNPRHGRRDRGGDRLRHNERSGAERYLRLKTWKKRRTQGWI